MKVLQHIISTGEKNEVEYPCRDINEEVYKLDNDIEYYFINEPNKPLFNELLQDVEYYFELTDIISEYPHLKQANKMHNIVNKSNVQIINTLNNTVGNLISENFPEWKKTKYIYKIYKNSKKSDLTADEVKYYEALLDWADECRAERDKKENELLTNGTLPDLYSWPEMPIKPE